MTADKFLEMFVTNHVSSEYSDCCSKNVHIKTHNTITSSVLSYR